MELGRRRRFAGPVGFLTKGAIAGLYRGRGDHTEGRQKRRNATLPGAAFGRRERVTGGRGRKRLSISCAACAGSHPSLVPRVRGPAASETCVLLCAPLCLRGIPLWEIASGPRISEGVRTGHRRPSYLTIPVFLAAVTNAMSALSPPRREVPTTTVSPGCMMKLLSMMPLRRGAGDPSFARPRASY